MIQLRIERPQGLRVPASKIGQWKWKIQAKVQRKLQFLWQETLRGSGLLGQARKRTQETKALETKTKAG